MFLIIDVDLQDYNFATWDNWAKTKSFNKNVKVYIGAAASADAAGTGYVDSATLANYVSQAQSKWSSFGGVMMWDMDTAYSEYYGKSLYLLTKQRCSERPL